jgi:uncharacterized protein YlxW (UPF0749 family)
MEQVIENNKNNKLYLIWVLIILLTFLNLFLYMKTKKMHEQIDSSESYNNKQFLLKIDSLQDDNIELRNLVIDYENRIAQYTTLLDSIDQAKIKTKIKYVNKFKEISDASADGIVQQLNGIFTENGINQ